ncbi:hypothetical protein HRG84_13490 [Flavisolibacter sp. BT320]|nr:hypothetical protein [Flavisolibacter longurius]
MRKIAFLILIFWGIYSSASAQVRLSLGRYTSNIKNFKDTTKDALRIASFILSTQEFRDSLARFKFQCSNLSNKVQAGCDVHISGQRVYDSLSRFPDTPLNITIKPFTLLEKAKNLVDKHDQIGSSSYGTFHVTTRSWFLNDVTKRWFASVKYAKHLAHEYCHIRGFYHNQSKKFGIDVPYTVGSLVERIIRRRLKVNEPIM